MTILPYIFILFQDTVSVHRPSFYAERFQRFMCNTVFRKSSKSRNERGSPIKDVRCLCSCFVVSLSVPSEVITIEEEPCRLSKRGSEAAHGHGCPEYAVHQPHATWCSARVPFPLHPGWRRCRNWWERREMMWPKQSSIFSNLGCPETQLFVCIYLIMFQVCSHTDPTCSRTCLPSLEPRVNLKQPICLIPLRPQSGIYTFTWFFIELSTFFLCRHTFSRISAFQIYLVHGYIVVFVIGQ